MTTVQIVLLSMIGVCLLLSVIFMIMFVVEIVRGPKSETANETSDVQSVFTINNINITNEEKPEQKEEANSVNDMLASLEEQTKDETTNKEQQVEEVVVEEEVVPEPVQEEKVEVKEEPETQEEEVQEEEVKEEVVEDSKEDLDIKEIKSVGHEIVYNGNIIDYKNRLEKVIETRDKIERDLTKRQKSILKYERTKRRMNRNQKMLDRRAGELTNLNLVMYSVTDIKNVDEEKKAKQEDLTAHIAELKASIQDAEEYIESNKDKNENNIRMAKYLLNEKNRFNEEITELQALIKAIEGNGEGSKAE